MERKYLSDFIYGGIDGAVTTFAVVSGVVGASLNYVIVLILGFANLFADGFSMAMSNYLATKSQYELAEQRGHKYRYYKQPRKAAAATFFSFVIIGMIPLISFIIAPFSFFIEENKFTLSFILTGIALLIVGAAKGNIIGKNRIKSSFETFLIGGVAALIAFLVGYFLRGVLS
ncbi:VIT1/CCC1 transporter family protein [Candidatus Pacearchaeota archaeon]|nr:VIT1/CCC1 transporter family protein [Candidatus Pacearchaeota archaeon]